MPNELTRVRLRISDGSVSVSAPTQGARVVVVALDSAVVAAKLMPDAPRTVTQVEIEGLRILAVETDADRTEVDRSSKSGRPFWKVSQLSHESS